MKQQLSHFNARYPAALGKPGRVDFLSTALLTWQAEIHANQVRANDLTSARRIFGNAFERRFGMNPRRILGLTLVIVAIGVAIALRSSADNTAKPGDVNEARVTSDAAAGNNWFLTGRTFDASHFSPLRQITDKNIVGLGLAWSLNIDSAMGVVSEPIIVDGVIYFSAPLSKVYAVEAASPFGTAKCTSARETAASLPLMLQLQKKFGRLRFANPRKRASPARRMSRRGKF